MRFNAQVGYLREARDQGVGHAVRQILEVGIPALVYERNNGNGIDMLCDKTGEVQETEKNNKKDNARESKSNKGRAYAGAPFCERRDNRKRARLNSSDMS